MPHPDAINSQIARQLKLQRSQKGWSLERTAQATGVSKAMLGQVERGESSPTIATLWKIATGLQCSFSSFITPLPEQPEHLPGGSFCDDPHMQIETLFAFNPATGMETFSITLSDFHEQQSTPHVRGVIEHIHVLHGELMVRQGQSWHQVKANEQFVLQADEPHAYKDNAGRTSFIDIISYPHS